MQTWEIKINFALIILHTTSSAKTGVFLVDLQYMSICLMSLPLQTDAEIENLTYTNTNNERRLVVLVLEVGVPLTVIVPNALSEVSCKNLQC